MKSITQGSILLSILGLTMLGMTPASAHQGGKANAGYVGDQRGHLAVDQNGKCIRSASWTPALALAECEGGKTAAAEAPKAAAAEPAPVKAVVAAVTPVVVPKAVKKRLSLDTMTLFDVNSADLRPTGKEKLEAALSEISSTNAIESIVITGYTDSSGAAEYNQSLSEKRAQSVASYLTGNGVPEKVISTAGKGEQDPVASNTTNEGRAKNRRVEIDISALQ